MPSSPTSRTTPDLAVLLVPSPDGERFVVAEMDVFLAHFLRAFANTSTTGERLDAMLEHLRAYPVLDAAAVRERLRARGMTGDEADRWIARARRMTTMAGSATVAFERITRIGYTNTDAQAIVARTDSFRPDGQRVFVMRCGACGHEYGSYGCDAHIRTCPTCQDGQPGLPVTA